MSMCSVFCLLVCLFFQNQDPVAVNCLVEGIRGSVGKDDKEVTNVTIFLFLIEMKPRKVHREVMDGKQRTGWEIQMQVLIMFRGKNIN